MEIRYAHADSIAGNFRVVPVNRECNRGRSQHTEIVGIVRVFPNVIPAYDSIFAERLLQASMEVVAVTGIERRRPR